MNFFKKKIEENKTISWKIVSECLDFICESAKSTYPKEFAGLLRVSDEMKYTIIEVILLPGTISGDSHAIFRLHMRPIDFSLIGSVHSHPSASSYPSPADLQLFRKYGKIHMIVAYPYDRNSFKTYDEKGNEIQITIV